MTQRGGSESQNVITQLSRRDKPASPPGLFVALHDTQWRTRRHLCTQPVATALHNTSPSHPGWLRRVTSITTRLRLCCALHLVHKPQPCLHALTQNALHSLQHHNLYLTVPAPVTQLLLPGCVAPTLPLLPHVPQQLLPAAPGPKSPVCKRSDAVSLGRPPCHSLQLAATVMASMCCRHSIRTTHPSPAVDACHTGQAIPPRSTSFLWALLPLSPPTLHLPGAAPPCWC